RCQRPYLAPDTLLWKQINTAPWKQINTASQCTTIRRIWLVSAISGHKRLCAPKTSSAYRRGRTKATAIANDDHKASAISLRLRAAHAPGNDTILTANRTQFGEILGEAGGIGLRLRKQPRPQTEAFHGHPWVLDGPGDGKGAIERIQPAL